MYLPHLLSLFRLIINLETSSRTFSDSLSFGLAAVSHKATPYALNVTKFNLRSADILYHTRRHVELVNSLLEIYFGYNH